MMCSNDYTNCYLFKFDWEDREQGVIKAHTGTSVFSWGEDITIKIEEMETGFVQVSVESDLKAQLVGWWVNEKNEKKFIQVLSVIIGQ